MTGTFRRGRRRYAHRATRRREPVFALAAGVILVAVCVPVAWHALSDRSDHTSGPKRAATTQSSSPRAGSPTTHSTTATTGSSSTEPGTTPIARTAPGVVIQVVPAIRDVQVLVDQTLYTTTADGVIDVSSARGKISVAYVGYSVIPALQEVSFRYWSDGLTSPSRTVDADGRGHLSLAVDVRYRVTVTITGATSPDQTLIATSPFGSTHFTDGERRWVLAVRGQLSGGTVVERSVTYSFDPPRGAPASQRQEFTAGPEALWAVRSP